MDAFNLLIVAEPAWSAHLKQTLFAREGMRIVLAPTIAEAQQKAKFAPPQLVIANSRLPDGNADALCRWFRSNTDFKGLRIVVMLEADQSGAAEAYRDAGADQVIARPDSPASLTPLVAQLVNAPMRQEIRVPVEIRIEGETNSGTIQGLTRNLSLGGAMLDVSGAAAEKGDMLYVRLHPDGISQPVVVKAEVMRILNDKLQVTLGVRFLRFDKNGRERLDSFLQKQGYG